jgi:hypothetical protein
MPVIVAPATPLGELTPPTTWGDPNQMFNTSQSLIASTQNYIASLATAENNLVAPVINPIFPIVAGAPVPATAQQPQLVDVAWNVPASPAPFASGPISTSTLPGPFTGVAPTLSFPAPPIPFTQAVPQSPALDFNFVYPTPSISILSAPQLLTLDPVSFTPFTIPQFTATVPTLNISAPNIIPYVEGALFTSQLLTDLQTTLDGAITFGTWTGLPPGIETNLYNRAREREYAQQADALAEFDRMETLGYAFPPGVYLDGRIKIQTETAYVIAGLSREIMTKQAELILENTIKAREQAVALESKLIDYANQVAQRSFETAKYATEASIAIYNGQVRTYEVSLEAYKTQAVVYDAVIRGIEANVQVLKAEIEFEQVKASINTALVEQYKAMISASELVLDVAKVQLQIIETQANVQKITVEAFGEEIRAFVGQVNAYQAQIDAYKALVSTQGVIEDVYKTQVEAYTATVNAGVAQVNANVAVLNGQIHVYEAQIEGFKAQIESMVGQATAASQFNTAEAEVYKAAVAAITSYNGTLTAQWEAVINEQEKIAEIAVQAAKANGDLYIAARGLALDASKTAAQVASQIGAAAVGAIHWANNSSWAFSSSVQNSTSTSAVNEAINSQSQSV